MASWGRQQSGQPWQHVLLWLAITTHFSFAIAMSKTQISSLRNDVTSMFYHGYDSYMSYAFPEDEIRPISCQPLTRDREHPENIGLNDALGNISLTLIDSLSTLAILASSSSGTNQRNEGLHKFQEGVSLLVDYYGDGGIDSGGYGIRGRGFDVDSKVQVFETTIRGIGGLLSAHLFAVGDLPIRGYEPKRRKSRKQRRYLYSGSFDYEIEWPNKFFYNGQLLRLAQDLGERLLPAFFTPTGIPYPRVNLRYGIPFYSNSPLNQGAEYGQCQVDGPEITETCSAGAGSLILEFTTLSRLTGDGRYEQVAKRAFHAVWSRRSSIGLVGSGIDAESGLWTSPFTGIGAGIDSFYEYAFKAHVLLSGLDTPTFQSQPDSRDPNRYFAPLSDADHSSEKFLEIWKASHASIKRNIYQELPHPHYINVHLNTGSPQIYWVDSLSAYYPGLLTLAGNLEEAIQTHLLYTALWTRYSALPERWSSKTGNIEGGLSWWGGRPETSESNYYLYRATRDPWYLHVGSMIVSDIKRRCWTRCGFSGIQDVLSGELNDRMESFFLGETTKYLFLLFDQDHPLNSMDSSFVFSTEGHPLIVPRPATYRKAKKTKETTLNNEMCTLPPISVPFSVSATAARDDVFHAASFARLHMLTHTAPVDSPLYESTREHSGISLRDLQSPSNYTFYPWTLPLELLPADGHSTKLRTKKSFDIQFPTTQGSNVFGQGAVRVDEGIMINSLAGLGLGLIRDEMLEADERHQASEVFRIHRMGNVPLGRDEKVYISRDLVRDLHDPNFSRVRDASVLDIVIDTADRKMANQSKVQKPLETRSVNSIPVGEGDKAAEILGLLSSLISQIPLFKDPETGTPTLKEPIQKEPLLLAAIISTGLGAIPPPDMEVDGQLQSWTKVYMSDESCDRFPDTVKKYQVIVMKRGGCSFSTKVASVPSSRNPPLVIVVSYEDDEDEGINGSDVWMIRPLLDQTQYTPGGLIRRHQIPLVMVGGGQKTYDILSHARSISLKRRYQVHSQGVPVGNLIVV